MMFSVKAGAVFKLLTFQPETKSVLKFLNLKIQNNEKITLNIGKLVYFTSVSKILMLKVWQLKL